MLRKITAIALIALTLASCSKEFLNQKAPDKVTFDEFWKDEDAATSYLMTTYAALGHTSWRWGEYQFTPLNYKGDDITLLPGSSDWAYLANMGQFKYDAGNSTIANFWSKYYSCIRYANDVIANVPEIPTEGISEERRKILLGEGHFLRALAHYYMNINFTTIVLVDEPIRTDNVFKPDVNKEAAWTLIEADFKKAGELLPESWDEANVGRATKGAALGFLGKAQVFQEKYSEAQQTLKQVMGLGYALTDDFEGMFNASNENSSESLFEIQYTTKETGGMWYSASQGAYMGIGAVSGWGMLRPSDFLITEFEKEPTVDGKLDKRALATLCYDDPDGESEFFGTPWVDFFEAGTSPEPMFKKFIDGPDQIKSNISGCNVPLLRYADILLLYAEAVNEGGGAPADALGALNQVRKRAGLSDFSQTGQEALRNEIRHQRILEFSCEGHRFNDMVRYGDVKQTLKDNGHKFYENYQDKNAYYPIPAIEVSQNPEVDPTPGY